MENYVCFINLHYEVENKVCFGVYNRDCREFYQIIFHFNGNQLSQIVYYDDVGFMEAEKKMRYRDNETVIHDVKTLFVMPGICEDDIRHLDTVIFEFIEKLNLRENEEDKEMYEYLSNYRCVKMARFFSGFKVKTANNKKFNFINETVIDENVYFVVREKKNIKFIPVENFQFFRSNSYLR